MGSELAASIKIEQRNRNLLASRGVPTLFILVSFLIIANIRCDHVGSTNVQKFHPNGRYGRRSVDNMAESSEAHAELGQLRLNSNEGKLKSILNNLHAGDNRVEQKPVNPVSRFLGANSFEGKMQQNLNNRIAANNLNSIDELDSPPIATDLGAGTNYQQELNKLLNCNYTGVSNLYWCANGAN